MCGGWIDYRCGRRDALMCTPSREEPFLCHTLTFDGASADFAEGSAGRSELIDALASTACTARRAPHGKCGALSRACGPPH